MHVLSPSTSNNYNISEISFSLLDKVLNLCSQVSCFSGKMVFVKKQLMRYCAEEVSKYFIGFGQICFEAVEIYSRRS